MEITRLLASFLVLAGQKSHELSLTLNTSKTNPRQVLTNKQIVPLLCMDKVLIK
jgi:hypothetical protein